MFVHIRSSGKPFGASVTTVGRNMSWGRKNVTRIISRGVRALSVAVRVCVVYYFAYIDFNSTKKTGVSVLAALNGKSAHCLMDWRRQ